MCQYKTGKPFVVEGRGVSGMYIDKAVREMNAMKKRHKITYSGACT